MRILFVTPFPPRLDATHGGAKVLGQILRHTCERHRVGLLFLSHRGEPRMEEDLRRRLEIVAEVPRPAGRRASPSHYARALRWRAGLFRGTPRLASELAVPGAREELRRIVSEWRPEVVRFEYPAAAVLLNALGPAPARLLVDYDVFLPAALRPTTARARLEHRLDLRAWARFRAETLSRVDATVVFTERDRSALARATPGAEIVVIPIGLETGLPALDSAGREPNSVLFVGNFNHVPNVDAAAHLVEDVMPLVRSAHPDAVLRLVGERPLSQWHREGVEVVGRAPDLVPYLDAAAVVAAPLRLGGGMRVKVMEALAHGKAVVAYPHALDGFDVVDGRHVLVAETAASFADAVSRLLSDPRRRADLGTAARAWALEHVGWERPLARYDELYTRLVARRSK